MNTSVLADAVSFFAALKGVGEELVFTTPHTLVDPIADTVFDELRLSEAASVGDETLVLAPASTTASMTGAIPAGLGFVLDGLAMNALDHAVADRGRITVRVQPLAASADAGTNAALDRSISSSFRAWPNELTPDEIDGTTVVRGDRPYRAEKDFSPGLGAQTADGRTLVTKEPMGPASAPIGFRIVLGARS